MYTLYKYLDSFIFDFVNNMLHIIRCKIWCQKLSYVFLDSIVIFVYVNSSEERKKDYPVEVSALSLAIRWSDRKKE